MRRLSILLGILFVTSAILLNCQVAKTCTTKEAIRAETEASSLQSWKDVYKSYKSYVQCDDGAIWEGYSDAVARLLSGRWSSVGRLNRLVSKDTGFEKFILRHIDELMSPAQAENIRDNAEARCPLYATRLCKAIVARVNELPGVLQLPQAQK